MNFDVRVCPMDVPERVNPLTDISNGSIAHLHDGGIDLLTFASQPLPGGAAPPAMHAGGHYLTPNVFADFLAIVRAVRDAELLIHDNVPNAAVVERIDVWH